MFPKDPWSSETTHDDPKNAGTSLRAVVTTLQVRSSEDADWTDAGCAANDTVDGDMNDEVGELDYSPFLLAGTGGGGG